MRMKLDRRTGRLLRRLPRVTVYSGLEIALLSLVAIQCARLVWAIVTPVGPVGEWRASLPVQTAQTIPPSAFAAFDPFFRLNGDTGPMQVTSLNIKLFGVREDRASGRGSAIISTPDGQQQSFAVGDEIVPGVTLTGVSFDSVTISRGGATEQLFLDQSQPAPVAGSGTPQPSAAPSPAYTSSTTPPLPAVTPPPAAQPVTIVSAPPRKTP
ncbi:type II secretory pathway component PulC [Allosphingosinicella flava]|uniref:Type II secretory pathway component PulC n=2 Tax=Allosphingosinicella flava TaxID=2771430 RepID=A0A7T2GLV3_9SPHN|nr:type II secretory pathway component PulC [Sphingosinicella flava]